MAAENPSATQVRAGYSIGTAASGIERADASTVDASADRAADAKPEGGAVRRKRCDLCRIRPTSSRYPDLPCGWCVGHLSRGAAFAPPTPDEEARHRANQSCALPIIGGHGHLPQRGQGHGAAEHRGVIARSAAGGRRAIVPSAAELRTKGGAR